MCCLYSLVYCTPTHTSIHIPIKTKEQLVNMKWARIQNYKMCPKKLQRKKKLLYWILITLWLKFCEMFIRCESYGISNNKRLFVSFAYFLFFFFVCLDCLGWIIVESCKVYALLLCNTREYVWSNSYHLYKCIVYIENEEESAAHKDARAFYRTYRQTGIHHSKKMARFSLFSPNGLYISPASPARAAPLRPPKIH